MQKLKQKFSKPLLLASVLCALPMVTLVSGCGGGNGSGPSIPSPVVPSAALVGNYTGTFRFTSGAANGANGTIAVTLSSNGTIRGTTTIPGNSPSPFTGRLTSQNGAFVFDDDDTVTGRGQLTVNGNNTVTGSGTFTDSDSSGGSGTFSLTKGGTPPAGLTVAQLVGTYRVTSLASPSGQTTSCPGSLTAIDEDCGANDTATLAATGANSGTLALRTASGNDNGTFTLSGNTLSASIGTARITYAVTLSGNTLTLRETSFRDTPTAPEDTDGVITTLTKV